MTERNPNSIRGLVMREVRSELNDRDEKLALLERRLTKAERLIARLEVIEGQHPYEHPPWCRMEPADGNNYCWSWATAVDGRYSAKRLAKACAGCQYCATRAEEGE